MARYATWVYQTKEEAEKEASHYVGHPYISVGIPVQKGDMWIVDVTFWECD